MRTLQDILRSDSVLRQQWLPVEVAADLVVAFEERFGTAALELACHASVPLVVDAGMVQLIRQNFLSQASLSWVAEADLLLSPLCRPIGEECYQFEPRVRECLLVELEDRFGSARQGWIAEWVLAFGDSPASQGYPPEVKHTHRWIGLAYTHPEGLLEEMSDTVQRPQAPSASSWAIAGQIQVATTLEMVKDVLEQRMGAQANQLQDLSQQAKLLSFYWYGDRETLQRQVQEDAGFERDTEAGVPSSLSVVIDWIKGQPLQAREEEPLNVEEKEPSKAPPPYQLPPNVEDELASGHVGSFEPAGWLAPLVEEWVARIHREQPTIVRLLGKPGSMRTRVVRALAEALASHYPDGLVYIDGRDHRHESGSQEKLLRTVLQAFAPEASFPPALDTLVREFHYTLKGKKSCIVIDYLEGAKPFSLELETSGPQEEARPTAKAQYGKFRYGETQYGSVEDEETQGFYQYLEPPLGNLLLLIGDKQPFDSSACLALDLDDAMTRFPQPSNLQHDIYVSAAQVDERRVRPILKGLQAEGWTVWSERNVLAGDHWRKEIEQAIEAAKVHLVVLTADSLASRYVMEEVEFGIARGHVIPVILDRMAIPEILLDRQVVDLRDWTGNRKDGDWLRLIERLRSVLGSTTSKNVGRSPEGMVRIPKGPFLYGDEKREVTINHDYYMDVYPVTNGAYRKFIEGSGYENQTYWSEEGWQWRTSETITKPRFWDDERFNGPDQPVVGVSYYEAEAYAKWAGKRLPTEQEWEKAARGTDGRTYPWGEEFEADRCANSVKGEQRQTTPVGTFPEGASPFGCQDMAGNVWEWCASWYDAEQKFRVLRGGSWSNGDPEIFRCALRNYFNPRLRNFNFGFRCAQDAP